MKATIKTLVFLLTFALVADQCYSQFRLRSSKTGVSRTFEFDGREREYRIHIPPSATGRSDIPLVFCLHGGGGNSRQASTMGLTEIANREGFIVVYPNAINKHWNDGRDSPKFAEQDNTTNDVAFIKAIADRVSRENKIDNDRIFATGLSNGGFMCQRLAIEASETFSAIGTVVATIGKPMSKRFAPSMPVSVLFLNGTKDPLVPYDGGPVAVKLEKRKLRAEQTQTDAPRGRCIATSDAVKLWTDHNGTDKSPAVTSIPDANIHDGSSIELHLWEGGDRGTAVALYKVIGGGHTLPGGRPYAPQRLIGTTNHDVTGFEVIWDFFKEHARTPLTQTDAPKKRKSLTKLKKIFPAENWEKILPASIGLDAEALDKAIDFAMDRDSSSVVVAVGGRIVAERHQIIDSPGVLYRATTRGITSNGQQIEDVASVQKSVVSVLMGVALSKELIHLNDPAHMHLGHGWSRATRKQESLITVRHLLSMTSGLNGKLKYESNPGTNWKYNTAAYAKTVDILEQVTGKSANELTSEWLTGPLGMNDSQWVKRRGRMSGDRYGFATTASDLARFGLLMLETQGTIGNWNGQQIVDGADYLRMAIESSQASNPSYGYLWWLNGKQFAIHANQRTTNGYLIPTAPEDLFAAVGALGRKCYVVPSLQLVVTRLGDSPDGQGKLNFDKEFWRLLMQALQ